MVAKCGRTDEHGGHTFVHVRTVNGVTLRTDVCVGNRGVAIVAIPQSPFVRRALARELPAKEYAR